MPKSIQEILDHADELARRFEGYGPEPGNETCLFPSGPGRAGR